MSNIDDLKQQLLTLEFNLKNDLDTLKICKQSLSLSEDDFSQTNLSDLLDEIIDKINTELLFYKSEKKKLEKSSYAEHFIKLFDLIRIRYTKLTLQIEKVFLSNSAFSEISSRLPNRREVCKNTMQRHNSLKNLKNTKNDNSIYDSNFEKKREKPNIPIPNKTFAKREKTPFGINNVGIDCENKEAVKKEIISLKNLMAEFRQKIDLHTHEEIENELCKIRNQNVKLSNDCQALKRDNTEILHTLHSLTKQSQKLTLDNETLTKEMSIIKKMMNSKNTFPNYSPDFEKNNKTIDRPKRILLQENQTSFNENEMISSWALRKLKNPRD